MGEDGSEWSASEPRTLDRFTMRPAGALRINGRRACVSATAAKKFVSKVCRRTSGFTVVVVLKPPGVPKSSSSNMTPALLIRMSSLP